MGVSFPKPADIEARTLLGPDRYMWGSDYPHDEGTQPFTREHLRQVTQDVPDDELRRILGENAAKLYDFDLDALAPLAAQYGPTIEELRQPLTELPENPNQALILAQQQQQLRRQRRLTRRRPRRRPRRRARSRFIMVGRWDVPTSFSS